MSTANDDFSRGLWLGTAGVGAGGTATVIFPSLANIAWVLAEIDAIYYAINSTNPGAVVAVTVSNSTIQGILTLPAGANVKDEWTWTGKIQAPLNTAITIAYTSPTVTGAGQLLNVFAYPV